MSCTLKLYSSFLLKEMCVCVDVNRMSERERETLVGMFVKMLFSFELSVNLDLCHEFKSVAKNILFFSFHSNFFYKKVFLNPIQLKSIDCVAPFRRHQCIWKLCFNIKWAIPFHSSFFFIFVFSSELEVNKFPND